MRVAEANTYEPLVTLPDASIPNFGVWVKFEFAVIGEKAFATVKEAQLPVAQSKSQLKPGGLFIYSTDAAFRKLEVLNLDNLSEEDALKALNRAPETVTPPK